MRLLPLLLLLACTGGDATDTGVDPTDTDTDTDDDTDVDTDVDPKDGMVTGSVVFADGTPVPDVEVQICSVVCRYTQTDSAGNFSQGGLEAARYKIDAIGATYTPIHGNSLYGVDVARSQALTLPASMVLPPAEGPVVANEASGEQTYEMGQVSLTFAATALDLPFGVATDGEFPLYAGVLEGTELTPLWTPLTPSFVVALLPWGAEPTAPMSLSVTDLTSPDGAYDVYALREYGEPQMVGTATVTDGTATASGLQPEVWTWLMFVPA